MSDWTLVFLQPDKNLLTLGDVRTPGAAGLQPTCQPSSQHPNTTKTSTPSIYTEHAARLSRRQHRAVPSGVPLLQNRSVRLQSPEAWREDLVCSLGLNNPLQLNEILLAVLAGGVLRVRLVGEGEVRPVVLLDPHGVSAPVRFFPPVEEPGCY